MEQETPKEFRDAYARSFGYDDWDKLTSVNFKKDINNTLDDLMNKYRDHCCIMTSTKTRYFLVSLVYHTSKSSHSLVELFKGEGFVKKQEIRNRIEYWSKMEENGEITKIDLHQILELSEEDYLSFEK